MGKQHQPEDEALDHVSDEIEELDELEEDVNLMAQKLAEFRETFPSQLQSTLASILSAQRPVNSSHPDNDANPENVALVQDDVALTEKIQTIKHKISSNDSAMLSVVKTMKDRISRLEKLESFNKDIHPAYKRRKITSQDCFM